MSILAETTAVTLAADEAAAVEATQAPDLVEETLAYEIMLVQSDIY